MTVREAYLVLEDGSVYQGESMGAVGTTCGEVVFNTSMTGYQEILTDPSYAGQIVVATYPLIGNYGVNERDVESRRIQVAGYVVREQSRNPSHYRSDGAIDEYLASTEHSRHQQSGYPCRDQAYPAGRRNDGVPHFRVESGRGAGTAWPGAKV